MLSNNFKTGISNSRLYNDLALSLYKELTLNQQKLKFNVSKLLKIKNQKIQYYIHIINPILETLYAILKNFFKFSEILVFNYC